MGPVAAKLYIQCKFIINSQPRGNADTLHYKLHILYRAAEKKEARAGFSDEKFAPASNNSDYEQFRPQRPPNKCVVHVSVENIIIRNFITYALSVIPFYRRPEIKLHRKYTPTHVHTHAAVYREPESSAINSATVRDICGVSKIGLI